MENMAEYNISSDRKEQYGEAIVDFIDEEKKDAAFYRIGLSSERIYDLGIHIEKRTDTGTFLRKLEDRCVQNSERETGSRIFVGFGDKKISAHVYCAVGPKRLVSRDKSRLSIKLAEALGIRKTGKKVILYSDNHIFL